MIIELQEIVEFWKRQYRKGGRWLHPEDDGTLRARQHEFMLDYPVVPFSSRGVPAPAVVEDLPSARMTRTWLLNALIPLVRNRQRLIIAWRPRLWGADCERTLATLRDNGVVYSYPRSKHLQLDALAEADRFSGRAHRTPP